MIFYFEFHHKPCLVDEFLFIGLFDFMVFRSVWIIVFRFYVSSCLKVEM